MSDEPKNNPISVRIPPTLRRSLELHLEQGDLVRSRFVRAAITEKLRRDRAAPRPSQALPS